MSLAKFIDSTTLQPDCSPEAIQGLCREAMELGFSAVCIPPYYVKEAVSILADSTVAVATVIGFPMGYSSTPSKVEEIKRAIDEGADELDVVINVCAVKSGNWNYVKNDIESTTLAAHLKGKVVKIILETNLLSAEELDRVCSICAKAGVDFVKTSTGFSGGTTIETIEHLRAALPKVVRIKASGGIRDRAFAEALIAAGASRLGTSTGAKIIS